MAEVNQTPEQHIIERQRPPEKLLTRRGIKKKFNEELKRVREEGEIDSLTSLLNLRGYERRRSEIIAAMKRHGTKTVVLRFDLDKLKEINDTKGHPAGSEYIKLAAKTLRGGLRAEDIIARTGGDEFTALLPQTETNMVDSIWEERLFPLTQQNEIAVSGGAAELDPDNPEESEKTADIAMYGAKKDRNKTENLMFVKDSVKTNG